MGFLQDAVAVFKKRELSLVDSRRESEDVYTFLFEKPVGLQWKAGQHGLFTITHKTVKNGTRPLTLASAPAEQVVQLTMRIGRQASEFKQAMLELQPGMKLAMSGPLGSFTPQEGRDALFIAGGIGITPFRAILKQAAAEGSTDKRRLHLLYVDVHSSYLFRDELDELAGRAGIDVTYLDRVEGVKRELASYAADRKEEASVLIAGPKSTVDAAAAYARACGIAKRNRKKDVFAGYE